MPAEAAAGQHAGMADAPVSQVQHFAQNNTAESHQGRSNAENGLGTQDKCCVSTVAKVLLFPASGDELSLSWAHPIAAGISMPEHAANLVGEETQCPTSNSPKYPLCSRLCHFANDLEGMADWQRSHASQLRPANVCAY